VRKKDSTEFKPDSLHHIVAGLMRYLRMNGHPSIDFFGDRDFVTFRSTLDAEMKRIQSLGIGSKKRQAEVLTLEEEDILWEKGHLGDATPQKLLDTMIYCNGLYFALRSGKEHRQLRSNPCQIELVEKEGERSYLKYTEDVSKNRPGGLKGRKVKPKVVYHHSNLENPERCFVRLFKKYAQLCPDTPNLNAFYLQPLSKPTENQWYSVKPLGHNTINNTMSRLCKAAGIGGFKTNHSLRATAATRLYQSGVDEQMIMEKTGHRSLDGIRSYKRTSDEQRETLSDIMNRKVPRFESQSPLAVSEKISDVNSSSNVQVEPGSTTNIQSNSKNGIPGNFTFNSCSVVFNIH